jgi:hypothetical protein
MSTAAPKQARKRPLYRVPLTPEQERRRLVPINQAAELLSISTDTFRRRFGHLIRTVSPRRCGVALGDVLDVASGE